MSHDERIARVLQRAREELEAERRRRTEPIAIVGIGCRFPGATGPDAFWSLLERGIDATREIPPGRWDVDAVFDPDPETPGRMYARRGGFLDAIDRFEPEAFGIPPREAVSLDPQQRLLLEVTWEALEDAGIRPETLNGSMAGVWAGVCFDDYARHTVMSGDALRIDPYSALGSCRSVAAGRLSYVLGLCGPAMQLDTSCSSSLVAVHLAAQSLRSGECDLAIAGGSNVICSPEPMIAFSRMRALAPDGRCKTFDASANGYGRGEGCGVIVLKRLSDAVAAGDPIRALIRGSAINHDGRSNGLTAPNGAAQEDVIRRALASAAVEPAGVQYVEAHGTGTPLGDPIEVLALSRAYGPRADRPLLAGSVKTNFGHLEGAAGIAGLIKVALGLQRRTVPKHLHFRDPNPHIPWDRIGVAVAADAQAWPPGADGVARGGVSSFGMSGTNAHVILEEAPLTRAAIDQPARPDGVIAISARSEDALQRLAAGMRDAVTALPAGELRALCAVVNTGRSRHQHRAAAAGSAEEIAAGLDAIASGRKAPNVARGAATAPPRIAFLFSGQGSQYAGMGRELYDSEPVFRDVIDRVDRATAIGLRDVMFEGSSSRIDETRWTQPAIFAIEAALLELWRSWGVTPSAVLGHSIGEFAAAVAAGVLGIEETARIVAARGAAMQDAMAEGAMLAASAPAAEIEALAVELDRAVSLAALNGPRATVVSGAPDAIEAFEQLLAARGIASKRLTASRAFHSPAVEPSLSAIVAAAGSAVHGAPRIPLISNLTGAVAPADLIDAAYWAQQVREPVRFHDGMQALDALGCDLYLEVGPSPVLLPMARACLRRGSAAFVPSLQRDQPARRRMLTSAGELFAHGADVRFEAVLPGSAKRHFALPVYPWDRSRRFWVDAPSMGGGTHSGAAPETGESVQRSVTPGDRLRAADASARPALIEQYVREQLAGLTGAAAESIDFECAIRDLGTDSLMLSMLDTAIRSELGIDIPVQTLAAETAQAMARMIAAALEAPDAAPSAPDYTTAARLDPDIQPRDGTSAHPPAHVLLTGATGFLGAFLLAELLERSRARIACLVRAKTPAEGRARLESNLARYQIGAIDWSRVETVPGDLTAPRLGLDAATYDRLAATIDSVYINGAEVSYVATFTDLRRSHVGGAVELLRLAAAGKPKAVHHVSSVAAFEAGAYRGRLMTEEDPPVASDAIHLAYSQCKWATDALAREASRRGMAVTIYRPSLISGHSRTGAWNTSDFLCRMLAAIVEMRAAPSDLDLLLDFSPVDYVSSAIVSLSLAPGSAGRAFHLQHPAPLHWSAFLETLESAGCRIERLPYRDWIARIAASPTSGLYPLLPFFRQTWGGGLTYIELNQQKWRARLATDITRAALAPAGIACPALDRALFERYLAALAGAGVLGKSGAERAV